MLDAKICRREYLHMSCGERLRKELRQAGYRVTPQRALILETVAHMEGHRSAQEVYEQAKERLPGLNLTTVYRTLETLYQAGIIDLFSTGIDTMRFSLHDPSQPHCHLLCRLCGEVFDVEMSPFEEFSAEIDRRHRFQIHYDHLTLTGVCENCRALQKP